MKTIYIVSHGYFFQNERQVIDVFNFIGKEIGGKAKNKKNMPFEEKVDVEAAEIDAAIKGTEGGAPILYLFFMKNNFDIAEVSADNCTIHLQAGDVIRAVVTFIAVFFVFHVGYASEHEAFLHFLQYAFIGFEKLPRKVSVGLAKLVSKFDEKFTEAKEAKSYKKFCV
jgi:hypothetical protein